MKRLIISEDKAASCYFRTSVEVPFRKALVQITERCNQYCAHCFVSAGNKGDDIELEKIHKILIPQLKACRVISVTITGGEPFVHHRIIEIVSLFRDVGMSVSICTNATCINEDQIKELATIGAVHCNVSLDGFSPESHGQFRGDKKSFETTISTIRALAEFHLLQGLLVTPNILADVSEYSALCDFAVDNGAKYVLMNPLAPMGRGVRSLDKLAMPEEIMKQIKAETMAFSEGTQLVFVRFPNEKKLPLASCEAGNIIYVFVHGELAVCPYLVFAAKTPQSLHKSEEFIVGNIFLDADIAERLDAYQFHKRYSLGDNPTCGKCQFSSNCGKGCPAAVIATGMRIGEVDSEQCPMYSVIE